MIVGAGEVVRRKRVEKDGRWSIDERCRAPGEDEVDESVEGRSDG